MPTIPTGTVTFLFTDIEGSTQLWEHFPGLMKTNLAKHDTLLRAAIEQNEGYVFKTVGDAFCAAFPTALDGISAAIAAQKSLAGENWGEATIRVRMGLHTGSADERDKDYFGPTLNRAARLMSAGHGGQILLSRATQELVSDKLPSNAALDDSGERRLKDLVRLEHIYQLNAPGLAGSFAPIKTLDSYRHNLPAQLTSFIGREGEMAEVKRTIVTHRLVTLTGPGGTGKTRLSLQVAADLLDQFPSGVWFVELAPLSNPELLSQTILAALETPVQPGKSATESLCNFFSEKTALLVLDNCEHLVEACARLVERLLTSTSALRILTSSREALGVKGEQTWHVPPLSLPDLKKLPGYETLSQYEAVRLFIERARLVQPLFSVTNANAPAVAKICTRLDGIPLAIELAAARLRILTAEQIASRLDDRFHLLTGGSRTALPRQQTLRALIDWSHDMLSESERTMFRRLAIFSGGWVMEAAEAVGSDEQIGSYETLDILNLLIDKSLVSVDLSRDELPRYYFLETIREYAHEKLRESDELTTIQKKSTLSGMPPRQTKPTHNCALMRSWNGLPAWNRKLTTCGPPCAGQWTTIVKQVCGS